MWKRKGLKEIPGYTQFSVIMATSFLIYLYMYIRRWVECYGEVQKVGTKLTILDSMSVTPPTKLYKCHLIVAHDVIKIFWAPKSCSLLPPPKWSSPAPRSESSRRQVGLTFQWFEKIKSTTNESQPIKYNVHRSIPHKLITVWQRQSQ